MKNPKSLWLLAAVTTIVVAVAEAAATIHLIPGTTIVDTGALLAAGFLAGLFMGFHITREKAVSTDLAGRSS